MSHEIRVARKGHAASAAGKAVGPIPLVQLQVLVQLLLGAERPVAFGAFKWFVLVVVGDVLVHGRGRGEALAAQVALVGFLTRVDEHVLLQLLPVEEGEAADLAVEVAGGGGGGIAALDRLHRLPILVGISVAVVHRRHHFVAAAGAVEVVMAAAVLLVVTLHLLLLVPPLFGEEIADGRVVARAFRKGMSERK